MPHYTLTVHRVDVEPGRVLLCGSDPHYHVIAPGGTERDVAPGTTIVYEPVGINFGWYVAAVPNDEHG